MTLDLMTSIGALRFETKLQSIKAPNNLKEIHLSFWADQYQIQFESDWKGQLLNDGSFNFNGEISGGKLNLGDVSFTRIQGWSNLTNKNTKKTPTFGGQVSIGAFNFKELPFSNSDLTFDVSNENELRSVFLKLTSDDEC